MASGFKLPELALQEDKYGSEEGPATKEYDPSSSSEVFPEGGLTAWATVFGS
jgi:hypothetical protein